MKYILYDNCNDCGEPLNKTHPMAAAELIDRWAQLTISAPLNTGACPKGCRPTYSDCNFNTKFEIREEETGKVVQFADLKAAVRQSTEGGRDENA